MVSDLFWVVPDEVWFRSSRQLQELLTQQIGSVSLESFAGLSKFNNSYCFTTGNVKVYVCCLSELPKLDSSRVLLDVDLDYFARYRESILGDWSDCWIDPVDIATELRRRLPNPEVTTISLSWNGGYTPASIIPRVLSICEGAKRVREGDHWGRSDWFCKDSYADYTQACGLLHRKRPEEAIRFAQRAVCANPHVGAYHYIESLCIAATGDLAAATISRDRCLSTGTVDSAQVLNDFAGITSRIGDIQNAILLQEKAFNIDKTGSPIISANLMSLYTQSGIWDKARDFARITLTRQPFNCEAFVVLATAAQHFDDRANMVNMWLKAAEASLDPRQKAAYRRRAGRLRAR